MALIKEITTKLNKSLIRLKEIHGHLQPSEISADIIVNASLNVLNTLYVREYSDINHDLSYREKLEIRRILSYNKRLQIDNDSYYNEIIECYVIASDKVVAGLEEEDFNYLRREIYRLLKQNNSEEVILNYYLNRHKFNPFEDI